MPTPVVLSIRIVVVVSGSLIAFLLEKGRRWRDVDSVASYAALAIVRKTVKLYILRAGIFSRYTLFHVFVDTR